MRKVYYSTPYDQSMNIGRYYNDFMELLPSDDCWAVFTDGDAMFSTPDYGSKIEYIIAKHGKEYPLLTSVTNRIGRPEQRVNGTWESNDLSFHRSKGEQVWSQNKDLIDNATNYQPIGGVLLALNKGRWKKVGKFSEKGMLGIDNDIHRKFVSFGMKVGIMKGIYMIHWYRGGDAKNKKHLL